MKSIMGKKARLRSKCSFSNQATDRLAPQRAAAGRAARLAAVEYVVESLERRLLLSTSPTAYLAALPSSQIGTITSGGSLQISAAAISGQSTPDYTLVDPDPQLNANGTLMPFATSGPTGLTAAQVRHAYGVDQINFGSIKGDGTGQTIAIIDAYDYPTASSDLHNFDVAMGLPDAPSFTKVSETGGASLPAPDSEAKGSDWEVEESLDIEWSHAMAPGANIVLVEANSRVHDTLGGRRKQYNG
jgi:subtilase family serine protease